MHKEIDVEEDVTDIPVEVVAVIVIEGVASALAVKIIPDAAAMLISRVAASISVINFLFMGGLHSTFGCSII